MVNIIPNSYKVRVSLKSLFTNRIDEYQKIFYGFNKGSSTD